MDSPNRSLLKKVAANIAGFTLVIAGVLMLVLPGPGLAAIAAGLAILSREYPWARRILDKGKKAFVTVWSKLKPKR